MEVGSRNVFLVRLLFCYILLCVCVCGGGGGGLAEDVCKKFKTATFISGCG